MCGARVVKVAANPEKTNASQRFLVFMNIQESHIAHFTDVCLNFGRKEKR
jgi:hypothetical protein